MILAQQDSLPDSAIVLDNQGVDDFSVIAEGLERTLVIRAHEGRIPLDTHGDDRAQLAFDALRCHGSISLSSTRCHPTISVQTASVYARRLGTSDLRSAAAHLSAISALRQRSHPNLRGSVSKDYESPVLMRWTAPTTCIAVWRIGVLLRSGVSLLVATSRPPVARN